MPPKCKFTKQEIIQAALQIARTEGPDGITARALGAKLGASSRPIFSVFAGMEEVQTEVMQSAKALYSQYVHVGLSQTPAFRGVGQQYIQFAIDEPKLFQMLFMSEQPQTPGIATVLPVIETHYEAILASVQTEYHLVRSVAERLYRHLWIYTHGIAALCATHTCAFTSEGIQTLLTEVFTSLLRTLKGEST